VLFFAPRLVSTNLGFHFKYTILFGGRAAADLLDGFADSAAMPQMIVLDPTGLALC